MFYWVVGAAALSGLATLVYSAAVIYVIVKIISGLAKAVMNLIPGQKERREFSGYMKSLEKSFKVAEKMDKKRKKAPLSKGDEIKLDKEMANVTLQCNNVQNFLLRPENRHVWLRMKKKDKENMMRIFSVGLSKKEVKLKL